MISARDAPPDCGALTIDRRASRAAGSLALRLIEGRFEVAAARPRGYDRPWAPDTARNPAGGPQGNGSISPQGRDATPSVDDLEAGD